jgi:hypothetical protein
MKKRRVLRVGSAMALLLAVGLVAGCPEDQVEEPAVEQEQPPVEPTPSEPTTPPAMRDQTPPPGETPSDQEPMMDEEPEEGMDQEPTQPQR